MARGEREDRTAPCDSTWRKPVEGEELLTNSTSKVQSQIPKQLTDVGLMHITGGSFSTDLFSNLTLKQKFKSYKSCRALYLIILDILHSYSIKSTLLFNDLPLESLKTEFCLLEKKRFLKCCILCVAI